MNENEKKWATIAVIVVVAFVVMNIISWLFFPFLPWIEEREAGEEVIEDTVTSENAIEEYEWFRMQYSEIETERNQLENARGERERFYEVYGEDPQNWSRTAEEEHNRIQTRITAREDELDNLVGEYNARSEMRNRALFKCQLPYQVDERLEIHGPPGSDDVEEPVDVDTDGEPIDGEPAPAEECDGLPSEIER